MQKKASDKLNIEKKKHTRSLLWGAMLFIPLNLEFGKGLLIVVMATGERIISGLFDDTLEIFVARQMDEKLDV